MMRNVVQIGLHTSWELAYLSKENWLDTYPPNVEWAEVPEWVRKDPSPFNYYGVDCVPESIVFCAKSIRNASYNNPRIRFLCVGVSDCQYSTIDCGVDKWAHASWSSLSIANNTIYHFISIPQLFQILNLDSVDILALDIDGYEHIAFREIQNWSILPSLILMEIHHKIPSSEKHRSEYKESRKLLKPKFISHLKSAGYKLIYDKGDKIKFEL